MSVVSYDHRLQSVPEDSVAYDRSLSAIAEQLSKLDWISALVVCGSYAKRNLAPGWSDLDLVAFYEGHLTPSMIADARLFGEFRANPEVPVGVDFASIEQFGRSRRIGGRPLAMTLELKAYAQTVFGPDPFAGIQPLPGDVATMEYESDMLVRADVNSWLRRAIAGYRSESDRLFDAAKTLLRIAMFASSPHEKSEFTVESYCAVVVSKTRMDDLKVAFDAALKIRRDWKTIKNSPESEIDEMADYLSGILVRFHEYDQTTW